MDVEMQHIQELRSRGYFCSQVLMILGLEMLGRENPDLVRASQGLAGGLGFSGECCGALTGASCLLGVYAGKGSDQDQNDPRLDFMVSDLVKWFKSEYGLACGGIRCADIVGEHGQFLTARCPGIVTASFLKVKELLVENGFDLSGLDRA